MKSTKKFAVLFASVAVLAVAGCGTQFTVGGTATIGAQTVAGSVNSTGTNVTVTGSDHTGSNTYSGTVTAPTK